MTKTYIIGDLHGCYDEFVKLSQQIGIQEEDLVISLGDIVDRGNKSLELYHYFKNRKNSIVLMGNHERKHLRGILSYSQEIVKVQFGEEYEEFVKWTETLPYYHETEEAIIVHAFFEHDVPLQNQKEEVLAGTTSGDKYLEKKYKEGTYWREYYNGEKPIIYGHHVVGDSPKIENNTYGIDTGACHGKKLTIMELPGFHIHQIQVETDHWKEQQAKWQIPVLKAKDWEGMKVEQIHAHIAKLNYKQEPEIREFLSELSQWITDVSETRIRLKHAIERLTEELREKYPKDFNQQVVPHPYRSFIFKANKNNLHIADMEKILDTPTKVKEMAEYFSLNSVPKRPNR